MPFVLAVGLGLAALSEECGAAERTRCSKAAAAGAPVGRHPLPGLSVPSGHGPECPPCFPAPAGLSGCLCAHGVCVFIRM